MDNKPTDEIADLEVPATDADAVAGGNKHVYPPKKVKTPSAQAPTVKKPKLTVDHRP